MDTKTVVVVFVIFAGFGLVAVFAFDIVLSTQEAEASRGCAENSTAFFASV
jgi:Flp pilus assembly protein CpaB